MTIATGQTWQLKRRSEIKVVILSVTHFTVKYTLKHGGGGTVENKTKGKFYAVYEKSD